MLGANRAVPPVMQEDSPSEGCSNPLRAARRARLWEKSAARRIHASPPSPTIREPEILGWADNLALSAGADCTFGGTALKIARMPAPLTVTTPTGALSAVPPLLCLLRGGCRNAGESPVPPSHLICKERWATDGRSSSSLSPVLTPLHAAGKPLLRKEAVLSRSPP